MSITAEAASTVSTGSPEAPPLLSAQWGLRILGTNVAGALMATGLLWVLGSPGSLWRTLAVSLLYAHLIGTPAALLLPLLARRVAPYRLSLRLAALAASLLVLAALGSFVAHLLAVALGLVPARVFWPGLSRGLGIAVVITLGVGAGMSLYETTRRSLEETRLTLKTRELEKAEAERLLAEARLASLESRLHPHFLFNAINAIAALIPEDPGRAERLLIHLADLLRAALGSTGRHTVALQEELALVRASLVPRAVRDP